MSDDDPYNYFNSPLKPTYLITEDLWTHLREVAVFVGFKTETVWASKLKNGSDRPKIKTGLSSSLAFFNYHLLPTPPRNMIKKYICSQPMDQMKGTLWDIFTHLITINTNRYLYYVFGIKNISNTFLLVPKILSEKMGKFHFSESYVGKFSKNVWPSPF